ncbi:MAG: hypothetical protein LUE92_00155 [Clostridiales bacterium]|nr:hypothetical protein [Clostridiales bacterium]
MLIDVRMERPDIYTNSRRSKKLTAEFKQAEVNYQKVIHTLNDYQRKLMAFYETARDDLYADDCEVFYRAGLKDGLRLKSAIRKALKNI